MRELGITVGPKVSPQRVGDREDGSNEGTALEGTNDEGTNEEGDTDGTEVDALAVLHTNGDMVVHRESNHVPPTYI